MLDSYQRSYTKNIDYIKTQIQPLLDFQYSLKYFGNQNNLYLKTISETRKKSDWLSKTKKSIQSLSKILENNSTYSS